VATLEPRPRGRRALCHAQDRRPLMRIEDQPDGLWVRVGEEDLLRKRTAAFTVPIPLRIAYLMAVDAALHDVAAVVQFGAIFALEHRVLLRRLELRSGAALSCQFGSVSGIPPMQGQRPFKRTSETLDGDVVRPEGAVRPRAEPPVNGAVRV